MKFRGKADASGCFQLVVREPTQKANETRAIAFVQFLEPFQDVEIEIVRGSTPPRK